MRAVRDEARQAFRMTFVDGLAAARRGQLSHAGWWADRHLRKGYFAGLPLFLFPALVMFQRGAENHTFSAFFLVMLPARS